MESFALLSSTEQKSKEQISRMDDARVFWNNENQRRLHNLDANHYRQYSLQSIEGIFHRQTFIFPFSVSWVHVKSAHSWLAVSFRCYNLKMSPHTRPFN